uniref:Uncharacterized protein n=1 Tax=Timema poppense TaxID=170557 RepID=A0A7R9HB66_TIMPO|nr:unnamed protein product [Timema poppensis]
MLVLLVVVTVYNVLDCGLTSYNHASYQPNNGLDRRQEGESLVSLGKPAWMVLPVKQVCTLEERRSIIEEVGENPPEKRMDIAKCDILTEETVMADDCTQDEYWVRLGKSIVGVDQELMVCSLLCVEELSCELGSISCSSESQDEETVMADDCTQDEDWVRLRKSVVGVDQELMMCSLLCVDQELVVCSLLCVEELSCKLGSISCSSESQDGGEDDDEGEPEPVP